MKSNLDINKVEIEILSEDCNKIWLDYNIVNLGAFSLVYDGGVNYLSFPFHKQLICEYENSQIVIFLEFIFKKFGKETYIYYNEEMEGYNLPKSKMNAEYSNTYSMFDLISDVFKQNGVDEKYFLVHTGNLNIDANWPYKFTTLHSIGCFYNIKYQPKQFDDTKNIIKKFLFLNKRVKPHREYLYKQLKKENIYDNFYYSYNAINEPRFNESISLEGRIVDIIDGEKPLDYYFETSFCNIVTESEFFSGNSTSHCYKSIFFTEKIAKPLNSFTPFILAGCHDSLKKLKELGFKTFSKWWDESYDNIEDEYERLDKIKDLIMQINQYTIDDCYKIYAEMKNTLIHNANLYQKYTNKKYQINTLFKEPFNTFKCFW